MYLLKKRVPMKNCSVCGVLLYEDSSSFTLLPKVKQDSKEMKSFPMFCFSFMPFCLYCSFCVFFLFETLKFSSLFTSVYSYSVLKSLLLFTLFLPADYFGAVKLNENDK